MVDLCRRLRGVGRLIRFLGRLLAVILVLDAAANIFLFARYGRQDPRAAAPGYRGDSWPREYYREYKHTEVKWHPYSYWVSAPYRGRYINTGDDGLRRTLQSDRASHSNGKVFRIFMFGGSTMWGVAARDDYTIPSWLQRLLDQSPYQVQVTNFGQEGYVNTQEVLLFAEQLRKNNIPDMVIFYDGINDTYSGFVNGVAGLTDGEERRAKEFDLLNDLSPERLTALYKTAAMKLVLSSGLGNLAKLVVKDMARGTVLIVNGDLVRLPHPSGKQTSLYADVIRVLIQNKRFVDGAAREKGICALFYWQPVVFSKEFPTAFERVLEEKAYLGEKDFFAGTFRLMAGAYRDAGIRNISEIFNTVHGDVFIDRYHITEDGNRMVAARMLQDVLPVLSSASAVHERARSNNCPACAGEVAGARGDLTSPIIKIK